MHVPASHLAEAPSTLYVSVMECVLVVAFPFPPLSLPLSMGTLGLRQSFVVKATSCVAEQRTPGIWSLSLSPCILSSPLFIPPFSQVFFGVAEASRTLPFSVSLALLSLSPSSTHSCIMRHIQLKTKFVSCASITALHFHLLISLSL